MATINDLLANIATVSKSINTNELVKGARDSVEKGLKAFMITPKEKAQIKANFEMQFTGAILTKIIDSVLQFEVNNAQIAASAAETSLRLKEIELKAQQIAESLQEMTLKASLNAAQVASLEAEAPLKSAQKILVDQQKLTEINTTAKVLKESALLDSNKLLVDAQKATQEKQRLDVMAGINIKNQQAISTQQSAKFEETRRHVLLKSTLFNNQIQKSKEENATLNSLAIDDGFVISDAHLTRVKSALDGISVADITYTSEITQPVGIVDAGT